MKALSLLLASVALTSSGLAQGTVQFQNGASSLIEYFDWSTLQTNKVTSANLPTPFGFGPAVVGVFWGTTAGGVTNLGGTALIGSTAGQIVGNMNLALAGTQPLDLVYIQVYAWDSSFGASLAGMNACLLADGYFGAASAGTGDQIGYGQIGAPLQVNLGPVGGPGVPIFGPLRFGPTVMLVALPEPSTVALGVLGVAAFWVRCRIRRRAA